MLLQAPHRFRFLSRGIDSPELATSRRPTAIRRMPFAPEFVIPLLQHTGAPAVPIVYEGEEVVRGEPIAKADSFVSVPMHAPATGVITRIGPARVATGEMVPSIVLRAYASASQEVLYGAPQNIESMSSEELVRAVRETGVVSFGSAIFPTHVMLSVPRGRAIDTVIVNACGCESDFTSDECEMTEHQDAIHGGIRIVQRAVGAHQTIIALDEKIQDAGKELMSANTCSDTTFLKVLKNTHPLDTERLITKAIIGREIPFGGLPADIGAAVFNVSCLAQIGELLPFHRGLIERVLTITGPGVEHPGNYLVPLGTPVQFALQQVGLKLNAKQVILGGVTRGRAIADYSAPITKGTPGILVLTDAKLPLRAQTVPQ